MSDDYAFFEYRAKIINAGHAEDVGEPVHCFIKMKSGDAKGKRRRNVTLDDELCLKQKGSENWKTRLNSNKGTKTLTGFFATFYS